MKDKNKTCPEDIQYVIVSLNVKKTYLHTKNIQLIQSDIINATGEGLFHTYETPQNSPHPKKKER